ncbi:hypothetical protein ACFV7Q_23575 [Streptomyces sp. NPDC059851]|uniref:hypothetical protein n=1 Tax=Streptomyces sp. NPDC059851 TaxID=3346971 RepID=UPI003650E562
MDGSMVDAVVASVGAAVGAYGTAVLTRGEDAAADATVRLGQRLLARLRRNPESGDQIVEAVEDVAAHPEDVDYLGLLRAKIVRVVDGDRVLAGDLAELLAAAGRPVVTVSGDRTAAVRENTGIVSLGDHASNTVRDR